MRRTQAHRPVCSVQSVDPAAGHRPSGPARWVVLLGVAWVVACGAVALGATASVSQPSPVPDAFAIPRFELLPAPPSTPRLKPVLFPSDQPHATVDELLSFNGRLWILARARSASPAPSPAKLWAYTYETDRLAPVRGVLEQFRPSSMAGHGREVWMAVQGGVAAFHSTTFQVEGFNAARGLTATNVAGIAEADGRLLVLSESGVVFGLDRSGENFEILGSPAPALNPRDPDIWKSLASSGASILALANTAAAGRHALGTQWTSFHEALSAGWTRATSLRLTGAEGDGLGGFWVGSDAGLHWLDPGNGSTDNWYWSPGVVVHSGLAPTYTPATRPSAASVAAARDRVVAGIRDRMRDRARLTRLRLETRRPLDPVTPVSRLPGSVRALKRDKQWLWVVTTDQNYTSRSRVLLFHTPTRKWVGWFPVSLPVTSLGISESLVFLGLDATTAPSGNALLAFEKSAMTSIPSTKWTPDELTDRELGDRLAALPVKERAALAFFAGDAKRVVELLTPKHAEASAEELFLLAFAHDPLGLEDAVVLEGYLDELLQRWPDTAFAEVVRGFRGQPATAAPRLGVAGAGPLRRPMQAPPPSAGVPSTTPESGPIATAVVPASPPPTAPAELPPAVEPKPSIVPVAPKPEPVQAPKPAPAARPPVASDAELVAKALSLYDADSDGIISSREYRAWMGEVRSFDSFDIDGDNKMDKAELLSFLKQRPKALLPKEEQ